jgi:hypothetical protein
VRSLSASALKYCQKNEKSILSDREASIVGPVKKPFISGYQMAASPMLRRGVKGIVKLPKAENFEKARSFDERVLE